MECGRAALVAGVRIRGFNASASLKLLILAREIQILSRIRGFNASASLKLFNPRFGDQPL